MDTDLYKNKYLKYKNKYLELKNSIDIISNNNINSESYISSNIKLEGGAIKKRLIFHILGPSGAGKTTLGNRLGKLPNTISIDTDDIDDINAIQLLNKYDLSNEDERKKFFEEKSKLNKLKLKKFLNKNKSKNIVFVGFDFRGMEIIPKLAKDNKYSIKVDNDTLFRQYNLRTLDYITKNKISIEKLVSNKNISIDNIFGILIHKYKIRHGFDCEPPPEIIKHIKSSLKKDKKKGYINMSSEEIFEKVSKLVKN